MKTWSEIADIQPLASKIMTNSIQKNRISHAYLIHGERGTGKEAIARLLAKVLFCENRIDVNPCGNCLACKRIDSGNHPDVHWIEPDGLSIKKEQIDQLQKEFKYSGVESSRKVYVIKDADTLTTNAANRILKFLEEPSLDTTAIMLTENSQSILSTIRSRCQILDLRPLNPMQFHKQLLEAGVSEDNAALVGAITNNLDEAIALNADEWFAQARKLVVQLIEMFIVKPEEVYLYIHNQWLVHFKERDQLDQGLDLLLLAFKDILYFHLEYQSLILYRKQDSGLEKAALYFPKMKLLTILENILQAKRKLKQNVHPSLVMEQLTLHIQR
ncbi:DNA polymerase III subunit delta' [Virgibacillus phasianinus]|uniref:DNA polymerase III subunit delta n=1 Tax=Virgibacillus phasianinus TaxID=2017483 RepID=A0A220U101_9BACI|nr:DNA polymerase III subunit delta' [Virgibacillus phasianinus]ASK61730.1 DNA polymerase III subunit delta' [Virgibacillus phasianinus]